MLIQLLELNVLKLKIYANECKRSRCSVYCYRRNNITSVLAVLIEMLILTMFVVMVTRPGSHSYCCHANISYAF